MIPYETFFLMAITVFLVLVAVNVIEIHNLLYQVSRDLRELRKSNGETFEELETIEEHKKRYRRNLAINLVVVLALEFLLCSQILVL